MAIEDQDVLGDTEEQGGGLEVLGDAHGVDSAEVRETEQLRALLSEPAENCIGIDDPALKEAFQRARREALDAHPVEHEFDTRDHDEPSASFTGWIRHVREWEIKGQRLFRLQVMLDSSFSNVELNRVSRILGEITIARMCQGNAGRFIRRAQKYGVTERRPRRRKFRPPLPYLDPPPQTQQARIVQEASLLEAAVAAAMKVPLGSTEPGRTLYVYAYDSPSSMAKAPINRYYNKGDLLIRLNRRALAKPKYDDERWGAVMAHEIVHNLGWGHGRGDYRKSNAIELYEACIQSPDDALQHTHMEDPVEDEH